MTTFIKIIAGLSVLAVTACSSGGTGTTGGGAGGGAGGGVDFDTNFAAAQAVGLTQAPITGSADYTGQVQIDTVATGDPIDIIGDLAVTIDFDGGANPISGTASNFAGTLDGNTVAYNGELTTAAAIAGGNTANAVTAQTVAVPVVGNLTTTGILGTFQGDLTEATSGDQLEAQVLVQGNMTGTAGAGSFGASGGFIQPQGEAQAIIGGTYYLNKN